MLGDEHVIVGRFWSVNYFGIAIVAVITEGIDWAAYTGADGGVLKEHTVEIAKGFGAKLSREDAKHFFPEIDLPYRT